MNLSRKRMSSPGGRWGGGLLVEANKRVNKGMRRIQASDIRLDVPHFDSISVLLTGGQAVTHGNQASLSRAEGGIGTGIPP